MMSNMDDNPYASPAVSSLPRKHASTSLRPGDKIAVALGLGLPVLLYLIIGLLAYLFPEP